MLKGTELMCVPRPQGRYNTMQGAVCLAGTKQEDRMDS